MAHGGQGICANMFKTTVQAKKKKKNERERLVLPAKISKYYLFQLANVSTLFDVNILTQSQIYD